MPPTSRGLRTRRHLIERCAHVFDRNGYAASTLEEMVRATGFTRGAFYFHFDSKDALAKAVVAAQADRWSALLECVRTVETEPLRVLVSFSYGSVALFRTDTVLRAASRLIAERAGVEGDLPDTQRWWETAVRALLTEAATAGALRDDVVDEAGGGRRLDALAPYLVHSWIGNQLQTVNGLIDLPAQLHTGWSLVLTALCRSRTTEAELQQLNDELAAVLRDEPERLLARFGAPDTDAGLP